MGTYDRPKDDLVANAAHHWYLPNDPVVNKDIQSSAHLHKSEHQSYPDKTVGYHE